MEKIENMEEAICHVCDKFGFKEEDIVQETKLEGETIYGIIKVPFIGKTVEERVDFLDRITECNSVMGEALFVSPLEVF